MLEMKIDNQKKILIIAPHPDDEIIGCFGIINKYALQSDVLLLTDGCKGHTKWSFDRTRRIRELEFKSVMNKCGVNDYRCLGIEDRTLNKYADCYWNENFNKYDVVFVPNKHERHPDHKAAFYQLYLDKIIKRYRFEIYQYEVWSPLIAPTHILDISNICDEKLDILNYYKSQISELDYSGAIKGLNAYRGIVNHIQFAECFKIGF